MAAETDRRRARAERILHRAAASVLREGDADLALADVKGALQIVKELELEEREAFAARVRASRQTNAS